MWTDERLTWNPEDFGGLDRIRIHSKYIWIPDITMYNSVGEPKSNYLPWDDSASVVVVATGQLIFVAPVVQKVSKILDQFLTNF